MDKSLFRSKTAWFSLLMGIAAFVPAIKEHVSMEVFGSVWGLMALVLRMVTKDKVKLLP